jgi:predicted nuclease with TOPRIM domain
MSEEKLDRIEATLERLEQGFSGLSDKVIRLDEKVGLLDTKVGLLDTDVRIISDRVDTYQKASTQVVNLAFSLIVAATLAIILPIVLTR